MATDNGICKHVNLPQVSDRFKSRYWIPGRRVMLYAHIDRDLFDWYDLETQRVHFKNNTKTLKAYIMQFTGIQDKFGEYIVEKDIVKIYGSLWIVEYEKSELSWQLVNHFNSEQKLLLSLIKEDDMEVLGNIYEHESIFKRSSEVEKFRQIKFRHNFNREKI